MSAADFRIALLALGWTQARAATELGDLGRTRINDWATGRRPVPRYIAAHVRTWGRLQMADSKLHGAQLHRDLKRAIAGD